MGDTVFPRPSRAASGPSATAARPAPAPSRRPGLRLALAGGGLAALVAAMALDTKVVHTGGAGAEGPPGAFSPLAYGRDTFPRVQKLIEGRAVAAPALAAAIAKDPAAAAKQYGVDAGVGPEFPVSFTGVAGKGDFGTYDVRVDGMPPDVQVRVQTGPAIMGTDLRDGTGTVQFGQFTNQIEYQNAGSALNKEMKKRVLSGFDTTALEGKTLSVVGVFQLTDPKSWLVTPVALEVK